MIGDKKRRVFIAINLPDSVKKYLGKISGKFTLPGMKVVKADNLHLTLLFLGYISDNELLEIIAGVKKVACRSKPFEIDFKRIVAGPLGKTPRMIWVEGERSGELANLKKNLEENVGRFAQKRENRVFQPHLTLARFKEGIMKQNKFEPIEINVSVPVDAVDIMESVLKNDGVEYEVLESVELGDI